MNAILNSKERTILQFIHTEGGNVSARQIALGTGISYPTVRKYVRQLSTEGILIEK